MPAATDEDDVEEIMVLKEEKEKPTKGESVSETVGSSEEGASASNGSNKAAETVVGALSATSTEWERWTSREPIQQVKKIDCYEAKQKTEVWDWN